jgi:hypothetical protein
MRCKQFPWQGKVRHRRKLSIMTWTDQRHALAQSRPFDGFEMHLDRSHAQLCAARQAPASCVASRAERPRRPWHVSPRVRLAPAGLFDRAGARLGRSKRRHGLRSRRQVNRAIFHPRNENFRLRFFFALVDSSVALALQALGRRPAGILVEAHRSDAVLRAPTIDSSIAAPTAVGGRGDRRPATLVSARLPS